MLQGWVIVVVSFGYLGLLFAIAYYADQRADADLVEDKGFLRVNAGDNGPGIGPNDQNVIFDKFRLAGDTLTDKPRGTRLGLPIRFHIVEHCGGRIGMTSRPGEDTPFSFTLPLVREPAPAEAV